MRILYILTSLGIGGAEKQTISLAERMARRGHSVSLLVLKHADEEWPTKLPVMRLNMSKTVTGIWRGLRFAQSFLTIVKPEVLHSHTYPANIFARLLRMLLSRQPNPPILINTVHNIHEGGRHRMFLYRVTDRYADAITAVSTSAADRFVKIKAVSTKKMTVQTNGIDIESFNPSTATRRRVRSQMNAADNFIWLAIGRIAPAKDYPNLLDAFRQVHQAQPKSKLWIAGEGSLWLNEVQADSIADSVEFLGLRRDIAEVLDAADGFVLPSAWEGMPLVVGEAMAMAKPIVATNVGGVSELLGGTGILVPAKDSHALAEAMLQIMTISDKDRIALGRSARERIQSTFSMQTKVEEWESLYQRSIHGE